MKPRIIILAYNPYNDVENDILSPEYNIADGLIFRNKSFGILDNGNLDFNYIKIIPINFYRRVKALLHRYSSIYRYSFHLKQKIFNKHEYFYTDTYMLKTKLIYNLNKKTKKLFDRNISNVIEFASLSNENNTKLIISTIPIPVEVCNISYKKSLNYIFKKFKEQGISIVDQEICLPQKYFYPINGHLNQNGHSLISEKISKYLLNN